MSKKALLVAGVSLMVSAPSFAAAFADVPFDHWSYQAVEQLAQAGVLEGYPDGLYRGPQSMTRYEFAVALSRAYDWIMRNVKTDGAGISRADVEALLNSPEVQAKFRGKDGAPGRDGAAGSAGSAGVSGKDGAPGRAGDSGKAGSDAQVSEELRNTINTINRGLGEFKDELKALGQDVTKMGVRLTALEAKLAALSDTVEDHESRISELERWRWFADVEVQMGLDGTNDKAGWGAQDGDLGFEAGEAFTYLSLRAGIDANLGGDVRGRFSWWYDSDQNPYHGNGANGLGNIGIDEAWVRLPGLGGEWIFGRQYAGQDYESGDANRSLGLGTGYYTGAALTGIRAQYGLGSAGKLTLLAQGDDNAAIGNSNVAGVARWDVDLPWFKDADGSPNVKLGFQSVAMFPTNGGTNVTKRFNDGSSSREFAVSANAWIDVLKGLNIEYTNQFRNTNNQGPDLNFNGQARGEVVYAELGVLETPTFTLDLKGGYVGNDFNLSTSVLTNQYVRSAQGIFNLLDREVVLDSIVNNLGPTQGLAADLGWNIGSRQLKIRGIASTRKADSFNWMIGATYPIIQTGNGNVNISAAYANVEGTNVLADNPWNASRNQGVVGVRVSGGLNF